MYEIERYHDISTGHRVVGHESKCRHLHGHNYRIFFTVAPSMFREDTNAPLDELGRVVDFSVVKNTLCEWLEENWDHKMLISQEDPCLWNLQQIDPNGVVAVPFNPTAENMAEYLVNVIAPSLLQDRGVVLVRCRIEETRKCAATYSREVR